MELELTKTSKDNITKIKGKNIFIVTFRQSIPGTREDPIANGRIFEAEDVVDALNKFQYWANKKRISTSDIYCIGLDTIVDRQLEEKRLGLEYNSESL